MNLFDFNPARNYCEWYEIATKGLCQDAKDRVLAEIEAHYADGLRELLDAGKTGADEAHRAAMAALGNPRHAQKAFRRAYLTKAEYKSLRSFTFSRRGWNTPTTEWILFGLIAGIAVVLGVAWCATEDRSIGTFIVILLWYVLTGLAKSVLKLSGIVDRRPRRVLGWCILVSAATFFLLAICVIVHSALFREVFNLYFALRAWGGLLLMCYVSLHVCIVPLEDMFRLGVVLLKLETGPGGNHETSR